MLTLAEKVRRLRHLKRWSQADLARRSGLGPSTIGHVELGSRIRLHDRTLQALAAALGVPARYFTDDDPRAYAAARLANLDADTAAALGASSAAHRLRWLLQDLREKWGEPFAPATLAGTLNILPATLEAMLDGRVPPAPPLLAALAGATGAPVGFFTGEVFGVPGVTSAQVREAIAFGLAEGLAPPSLLRRWAVRLAEKCPGPVADA